MHIVYNDQISNLSLKAQVAHDLRVLKETMYKLYESRVSLDKQVNTVKKILEEKR
ncbi:MAG: hypothetical protein JXB50_16935 [Spirochaetes bacterium]|nr:hypothetical protein [Spirochaetota bacterium]